MTRSSRRVVRCVAGYGVWAAALGAFAMCIPASQASAAITRTQITTPSSPAYLLNNDSSPDTFTVAGTTNSTAPASDKVDIDCFSGDTGGEVTLLSGVSLSTTGSFSVSHVPLAPIEGESCILRAEPTGDTSNVGLFGGPIAYVSEWEPTETSGGPNNGVRYDYYAWGQGAGAADDFDSVGSCGLDDSYLFDTALGNLTTVFYCNAFLSFGNLNDVGNTRSEIQVDGVNAYTPGSAEDLVPRSGSCPGTCNGTADDPGFPAVTATYGQNPTTGMLTITESDPIVRCPTGSPYPPQTQSQCPSLSPTPVKVSRTITQSAAGHAVSITDSYRSTDGHPHALDVLYQNNQVAAADAPDTVDQSLVGYQFPGQASFAAHTYGDRYAPPAGPGTIFVKDLLAVDGDPYTGQGAIGYSVAPTEILFISASGQRDSSFTMHYTGTVPASGALTYHFVYTTDYTAAAVKAEGLPAEDAFVTPAVRISRPGLRSKTHAASITVKGNASDAVAIASVTVRGRPVTVGASGAFSTRIPLRSGRNTITAIATNVAGNRAEATVTVTDSPGHAKAQRRSQRARRIAGARA